MGQWSTHPLGNDYAADYADEFYKLCKIPQTYRYGKKAFLPKHVAALVAALPLIRKERRYVLPWMIHESRTRIADKRLSATVKALIEFTPYYEEDEDKEPSPTQLIDNLYEYWDGIMAGKIPFESVEGDPGIIGAMVKAMEKAKGDGKGRVDGSPKKPTKKSASRKPKS